MGYYTTYTLSAQRVTDPFSNPPKCRPLSITKDNGLEELEGRLHKIGGFESGSFDSGDVMCGWSKWYDWQEDMTEISAEYPDTLFSLHGEGEDHDDVWDCDFYNGKSQLRYAEITYPPMDWNGLFETKAEK